MKHIKQLIADTLKGIAESLCKLSQPKLKHESTSDVKQEVEVILDASLSFKTDRLKLISKLIYEMIDDNTLHHPTTFNVGDEQVKYNVFETNNLLGELCLCIQRVTDNKTVDKVDVKVVKGYIEKEVYAIPDPLGGTDFVVTLSESVHSSKLFIFNIRKIETEPMLRISEQDEPKVLNEYIGHLKAGQTKEAYAKQLNISTRRLREILNGQKFLDVNLALTIATLHDVPVIELLNISNNSEIKYIQGNHNEKAKD